MHVHSEVYVNSAAYFCKIRAKNGPGKKVLTFSAVASSLLVVLQLFFFWVPFQGDTSGDYRKILLKLCGGND